MPVPAPGSPTAMRSPSVAMDAPNRPLVDCVGGTSRAMGRACNMPFWPSATSKTSTAPESIAPGPPSARGLPTASRSPAPGLVHHSDRGVQYCCGEYRAELEAWGMVASMSRTGDCYDNAPQESFWATLKKELMGEEPFATREQARAAIFEYIEVFYNRQRMHSSLGYVSPEEFEASQG